MVKGNWRLSFKKFRKGREGEGCRYSRTIIVCCMRAGFSPPKAKGVPGPFEAKLKVSFKKLRFVSPPVPLGLAHFGPPEKNNVSLPLVCPGKPVLPPESPRGRVMFELLLDRVVHSEGRSKWDFCLNPIRTVLASESV